MGSPGWLSQRHADVPPGEEWLGEQERRVLDGLKVAPRRASWRLGRWTAKSALAAWLVADARRIEVLAAADGAPEAWLDGGPAPVSVSISHRGDRALAVVAQAPAIAGCDLELVEPRSGAFIREWLALPEQQLLDRCDEAQRPLLANLIWSAKEASAKVHREGLRLNVRRAVVSFEVAGAGERDGWRPLAVDWADGRDATAGWWRSEPGWVMTLAGDSASSPPLALSAAKADRDPPTRASG